jgi:hypothetical protein
LEFDKAKIKKLVEIQNQKALRMEEESGAAIAHMKTEDSYLSREANEVDLNSKKRHNLISRIHSLSRRT